jgi:acyl carrier protein
VECGALDVLTRIVSGSLPSAVTVAPLREAMPTSDLSARLRPLRHPVTAGLTETVVPTPAPEADAEILEEVRAVCADVLEYPLEVITDDADFQADLGVDSLAMTELLERALRRYGLNDEFHVANAGNYDTVAELAAIVTGLLRDRATSAPEQR